MIKNIWHKITQLFTRKTTSETTQTYPSYGGHDFPEGSYKIDPPIKLPK